MLKMIIMTMISTEVQFLKCLLHSWRLYAKRRMFVAKPLCWTAIWKRFKKLFEKLLEGLFEFKKRVMIDKNTRFTSTQTLRGISTFSVHTTAFKKFGNFHRWISSICAVYNFQEF